MVVSTVVLLNRRFSYFSFVKRAINLPFCTIRLLQLPFYSCLNLFGKVLFNCIFLKMLP